MKIVTSLWKKEEARGLDLLMPAQPRSSHEKNKGSSDRLAALMLSITPAPILCLFFTFAPFYRWELRGSQQEASCSRSQRRAARGPERRPTLQGVALLPLRPQHPRPSQEGSLLSDLGLLPCYSVTSRVWRAPALTPSASPAEPGGYRPALLSSRSGPFQKCF